MAIHAVWDVGIWDEDYWEETNLLVGRQVNVSVGTVTVNAKVRASVTTLGLAASRGTVTVTANRSVSTTVTNPALLTVSRGTVTVNAKVSAPVTATGLTVSRGTVTVNTKVNAPVTAAGLTVSRGTVTVITNVGMATYPTGQQVTASRGTPTVTGGAKAPVTSPQLTTSVGTVSVTANRTVLVSPAVSGLAASVGTVSVTAKRNVSAGVTTPTLTAQRGTVTATSPRQVPVTGQQVIVAVGIVCTPTEAFWDEGVWDCDKWGGDNASATASTPTTYAHVGDVTIVAKQRVSVSVTATAQAVVSVGTITFTGGIYVSVSRPNTTSAVGTVTVIGNRVGIADPTSPGLAVSVGSVTAKGSARAPVTVGGLTAAVGVVTVNTTRFTTVQVTAPGLAAQRGTVTVSSPRQVPVTGQQAEVFVGTVCTPTAGIWDEGIWDCDKWSDIGNAAVAVACPTLTISVGNVGIVAKQKATVAPSGVAVTVSVGTFGVAGSIHAAPIGQQVEVFVGVVCTPTEAFWDTGVWDCDKWGGIGNVVTTVATPTLTVSVGNVSIVAKQKATFTPSGVAATVSVGTVGFAGRIGVAPDGQQAAVAVGTVCTPTEAFWDTGVWDCDWWGGIGNAVATVASPTLATVVGNVSIVAKQKATFTPSGVVATTSVGTVGFAGRIGVAPDGQQVEAFVGVVCTPTEAFWDTGVWDCDWWSAAHASATVASPTLTVSVGNVSIVAKRKATFTPSGVSATVSVGTLEFAGRIDAAPIGQQVVVEIGTVCTPTEAFWDTGVWDCDWWGGIGNAVVTVAAPGLTISVGNVGIIANRKLLFTPSGVVATASVGTVGFTAHIDAAPDGQQVEVLVGTVCTPTEAFWDIGVWDCDRWSAIHAAAIVASPTLTTSVGAVGVNSQRKITVTPEGVAATVSIGMVGVAGGIYGAPVGQQVEVFVGTVCTPQEGVWDTGVWDCDWWSSAHAAATVTAPGLTVSVGNVGVVTTRKATFTPAGVAATVSVGTVGFTARIDATPDGQQVEAFVGVVCTPTEAFWDIGVWDCDWWGGIGNAVTTVAAPGLTASVGAVAITANRKATFTPGGVAATVSVGTLEFYGSIYATPDGQQVEVLVGTVCTPTEAFWDTGVWDCDKWGIGNAAAIVGAPGLAASVGVVGVVANRKATVTPSGVAATVLVGTVEVSGRDAEIVPAGQQVEVFVGTVCTPTAGIWDEGVWDCDFWSPGNAAAVVEAPGLTASVGVVGINGRRTVFVPVAGQRVDVAVGEPLIQLPPSEAGGVMVWDGSAWVQKPAKVWTGSAWLTKPVKTWNGSAWQ